ncbi:Hsp70 family protein, partial [Myxococcota bacterium]|nr:Hsp70 family protein [Myxococcota bacterium]
ATPAAIDATPARAGALGAAEVTAHGFEREADRAAARSFDTRAERSAIREAPIRMSGSAELSSGSAADRSAKGDASDRAAHAGTTASDRPSSAERAADTIERTASERLAVAGPSDRAAISEVSSSAASASTAVRVTPVVDGSTPADSGVTTPASVRPAPRTTPYRAVVERDSVGAQTEITERPRPGTSDFSEEVTEFPSAPPPGMQLETSSQTRLARDESAPAPMTGELLRSARAVGIDFGGRSIRIGTLDASGQLQLLTTAGASFVPALVAVRSDGTLAAGAKARSIFVDDPSRAIAPRTVLRAMKSGAIDPASKLTNVSVENGRVFVDLGVRTFELGELLTALFAIVRSTIVAQLGDAPVNTIVSIPSDLDPEARTLLKESAKAAKLPIARLVSEPEALIRAYSIDDQPIETMLMVDVGATHVGLAIARRGRDGFAVVGSRWVNEVSATDLDARVVELTLNELATQAGEDHRGDPSARIKLLEAAERARMDIRRSQIVELKVSLAAPGGAANVGVERTIKLSRGRIYQVTEDAIRQILAKVQELLREVGVHPRALGAVVLAGSGGLYPPLVQALQALTQKDPLASLSPAHVFALGLARVGSVLERSEIAKRPDSLSASIGIELPGGRFRPLIRAGEQLPIRLSRKHATTRDNQTEIELELYQGEGETVRSCTHLGKITLTGVPKGPRGTVQIDLQIDVDMDEVATVALSHQASGHRVERVYATKQTPDQRRTALAAQRAAMDAAESKDKPAQKKGLLSRLLGR